MCLFHSSRFVFEVLVESDISVPDEIEVDRGALGLDERPGAPHEMTQEREHVDLVAKLLDHLVGNLGGGGRRRHESSELRVERVEVDSQPFGLKLARREQRVVGRVDAGEFIEMVGDIVRLIVDVAVLEIDEFNARVFVGLVENYVAEE